MAKTKIVTGVVIEELFDGQVTWLYKQPFNVSGLMYGLDGYMPIDELEGMVEEMLLDTLECEPGRVTREVYDADGRLVGMVYEFVD